MNTIKTHLSRSTINLSVILLAINAVVLVFLLLPQPANAQRSSRGPVNQFTTLRSWQGFGATPNAAEKALARKLVETDYTFPGARVTISLSDTPGDPKHKYVASLVAPDGYDGKIVALKW